MDPEYFAENLRLVNLCEVRAPAKPANESLLSRVSTQVRYREVAMNASCLYVTMKKQNVYTTHEC